MSSSEAGTTDTISGNIVENSSGSIGGGGDDRIDGGTAPGTTAGLKNTVVGHQGNDVIFDPSAEINEAFTFNFNLLLM